MPPTYTYDSSKYYWGCGYTYGFRVPFLVVSAYTPPGTVSGSCTQNVNCVGGSGNGSQNVAPHQHDFGSILAFIEYNFGLGIGCINSATDVTGKVTCNNDSPTGGPPGNVPFADFFAPEVESGDIPLADFFGSTYYPFNNPITLVNNSFTADYFYNFVGPYTDPDNDVIDDD